jgi:hypothetical protein
MNADRLLAVVLTVITKLPGLLRWIGGLFDKSLEERLSEVRAAEKELKSAVTKEQEDAAIRKISNNLHSSDR